MGAKRGRLVINGMPSKLGLMTSGHQQDIPETALWRAKNVVADLDGIMQKRPSLHQWGQTLKQPNEAATGSTVTAFVDFLSGTGALVAVDTSSGAITASVDKAYLQYNVPTAAGAGTLTHYYPGSSISTKWGLRLLAQGSNLSAYTAAGTAPNSLAIRGAAGASTGKEFVLWSGGLYYKRASDSQYVLVAGTTLLGLGAWKAIEIRCDTTANTTVYVDDTLVDTIASSAMATVALNSGALFEVAARVEGSGAANKQYNARVATLMYNDTATSPFSAQEIVATTGFAYVTASGATLRTVLAAAGDYIYVDRMEQIWRPLHPKQRADVFFTTYQRTLIWSDNDRGKQASLWQWDGLVAPTSLSGAPNFLFMTEHQLRLAGVDRKNPLMLLISKFRDPNVYLDPDNLPPGADLFDLTLDAAAIPVPAKRGDAITCVHGDYYGSLIIWTTSSVWRLTGNGPFTFSLANISQTAGCVNAKSEIMVGNDIFFAGFYGVHSLQSTEQFGDIQVQYPSLAIQSMWQDGGRSPILVNRHLLGDSRLAHLRTRGLVYFATSIAGEHQMMVYSVPNQQWYGPWDIESIALDSLELESPLTEVVMHGGSAGKLAYTDFNNKADYNTDAYEAIWEWANLNGRSVDPALVGQMKSWKLLRLYFLPRGKFDYRVRWYASNEDEYSTSTENQMAQFPGFTVGEDMRVDVTPDGEVYSAEEIAITEIDLDARGYSLNFDLMDSGLGTNLVPLGFQVEFDADGYEVAA